MARIPLLTSDSPLSPDQRRVHDRIVAGPRGTVVAPLRAALHNPDLAEHWQQLGAVLRYGTSLPQRLKELAILVTAQRWGAEYEWATHEREALKAGLPESVIDALRGGGRPELTDDGEAVVYDYTRELQETGRVSARVYREALDRFGVAGVVELAALIGYYTMVAMSLNAHEITMEDVR